MKSLDKIRECKRLIIDQTAADGFAGHIHIGGWEGSVVASWDGGWDHVSVSPFKRRITPSWSDMQTLKEIMFEDDEVVIQIHPVASEYVNNVVNCLHLWRYQGEMPTPPSWMVGIKKGESLAETFQRALEGLANGTD